MQLRPIFTLFFFNHSAPSELYTLSLHDALPIWSALRLLARFASRAANQSCMKRGAILICRNNSSSPFWNIAFIRKEMSHRSEEHTSELQSRLHLVCRLLLEKKNKTNE